MRNVKRSVHRKRNIVVIGETEDDLIKRLNEWKDNVENIGMRVNMNKPLMISAQWKKVMQKAARWPCDVYCRAVGNNGTTSCFIKSGPFCIFAISFSNVDRFE